MALFVKRKDTGDIVKVRKYIAASNEENIWSNEWYGRHIIGKDCDWYEGVTVNNTEKIIANFIFKHVEPDFTEEDIYLNIIIEQEKRQLRVLSSGFKELSRYYI